VAYTTTADVRRKLASYFDAGLWDTLEEDEQDALLEGAIGEGEDAINVVLLGRCRVTDAAASGVRTICTLLAAVAVVENEFSGANEALDSASARSWREQAELLLRALRDKTDAQLALTPGLSPPSEAEVPVGSGLLSLGLRIASDARRA